MKTKHFLGIFFIGLGIFVLSVLMKTLHLAGAQWILLTGDITIAIGLLGFGAKIWNNPHNPWLNH